MPTIPFFPLNLVAFPYESLSLHVFEDRYKQLVEECLQNGSTFGIPTFDENKIKGLGTEMRVAELVNKYPDGRMDIRTEGIRVFKVESFENQLSGKLYAGGQVTFLESEEDSNMSERLLLLDHADKLFKLLDQENPYTIDDEHLSFKLGHLLGLSFSQEYHLLSLTAESERIQFLVDHLTRAIPIVREVEKSKKRVKLNGHFKNFDPLKF